MERVIASKYLTKWAARMRPSPAPFGKDDLARDEWLDLLAATPTETANAAWAAWQATGATRWPNLYQMRDLISRHTAAADLGDCDACLGHGWVDTDPIEENGHTYSAVTPCTCPHGRQAIRSTLWRELNDTPRRELPA